ncbi:hypothetical protein BK816_00205 [Boudabousia tangfeifanii]|uniref:PD-(D/E)XK motif protein n=1 Tax=Boudabousia tangfeifanii TaxID=1912795 RepID=A0A1D9MHY4_9ACTO|nr:PD-(D/E)XK motif protein [Boudabousia tangfeifanii]AOZ71904.1 hypothetical protein BK816_00205 [Boudabousia tangfeifanii]
MTNTQDYWKELQNSVEGHVSTIKLDQKINPRLHDIFWIKDIHDREGLKISYADLENEILLPHFSQIEVINSTKTNALFLMLNDRTVKGAFTALCENIASSLQLFTKDKHLCATKLILAKWSKLLSVSKNMLSTEAQRGLIGELTFLSSLLKQEKLQHQAIQSWTGIEGTNQDFSFGNIFVEVKTKHNESYPHVTISSEYQLSTNSSEALYLAVYSLAKDPSSGKTLNQFVDKVRNEIPDPLEQLYFDNKLAEYGFSNDDKYTIKWSIIGRALYEVKENFPRLTPSHISKSISKVSYSINTEDLKDYKALFTDLYTELGK